MAKAKTSLIKDTKFNGDLLLRVLVGLLFICIGIEGLMGDTSNGLFRALDNEVLEIILGVLLLLCGVLLIVPSFLKGINKTYVKISMIAILVVWVLTIVITDFVNGLGGVNGDEWIYWIEQLVTHLLILASVWKVSSSAF
ncbi:MAG: hypothetical protein IAC42_04405 [Spirochaetes bacterium]|uniref:Uncharacterized protein n=1 Tax=Candidatus Aphodenecus pullistercoris TaxID=2840669 RepID=A0A9D9H976_9SPIR|nr:hypothetical protein [Candidatus Aphodenecus pullistercoris]